MSRVLLPIALLLLAGLLFVLSRRDGGIPAGPDSTAAPHSDTAADLQPVQLRGAAQDASTQKRAHRGASTLKGLVIHGEEGRVSTLHLYRFPSLDQGSRSSDALGGLGDPLREATSGVDGAFIFNDLPNGRFVLDARAADGSRGSTWFSIDSPAQRCWEIVNLRGGEQTLAGRAITEDGRPWRGLVAVRLHRDVASARVRPDFIQTGESGAFAFSGLPSGKIWLVAWQPGEFRYEGRTITLPSDGPHTFVIPASPSQLSGVVLDAKSGAPIGGAHVLCRSELDDGEDLTTRAHTDPQGRFRTGRLKGEVTVTVSAEGFAQVKAHHPSGTESIEVGLKRLATVAGVTLSAHDRKPVRGVLVHAHCHGDDKAYSTTSDAEGRFRFVSLPPGRWVVVAMGRAWQSASLGERQWSRRYQALGAGDSAEVELLLARAARAEGRVLDAQGQPVAGASVWVDPEGFHGLLKDLSSPWVVTDSAGRFAIETLVPGIDNRLRARRGGTADGWTDDFRPTLQDVTRIDVVLPAERWLHATVVSQEGDQSIPGAWVTASRYREWMDLRRVRGGTDDSGKTRLGPLPPGAIEVEVSADGYVSVKEVIPEDSIGQVLRKFALVPGSTISGRCVFADGTPAPDMHVWATGPGEGDLDSTGADGVFSLDDLTSGDWKISIEPAVAASSNWTAKHVATVRAGTHGLEFTVDATFAKPIRITVTDPDGHPVPQFDAVGDWYRGPRPRNGELRLPTGHIVKWIEIRNARTSTGEVLPLAPAIIGPLDNGRTEVDVQLEHGYSIRGRVVDAAGRGVQGVEISAWPEARRPFEMHADEHAETATDNEGAFALIGLWAGEYRIMVTRKEPYADTMDVVTEAGSKRVLIKLKSSIEAQVRIVDPEGRPVHDADVQVRRQGGRSVDNPHTDREGRFTLQGLEADGEYRIAVEPPESRPELGGRTWDAWRPSDDELTLPSALAIRGRVLDPQGGPAQHVYVRVRREGAEEWGYEGATADEDGRFVIGHLAPGTYRVRATEQGEDPLVATSLVEAGASDVELRLKPGSALTLTMENAPPSIVGTRVVIMDEAGERDYRKVNVGPDLTARFQADPTTTYTFYRWYSDAGVAALQAGIRGDARQVVIRFEPARSLRVRVLRPQGSTIPAVTLTIGVITRRATEVSPGTFEFAGLPSGTYTVSVATQTRSGRLQAEATGRAGESIEVLLR